MNDHQARGDKLVFYVEDDPVNALLMRMLFERRPHLRLEVASSGQHALALARTLQPALLLLDLRLPDCFGADLLALLRREPGWRDLPAVAVTAEFGFEAMVEPSGFVEMWQKPLDLRHVLARLDDLLAWPSDELQPQTPHPHTLMSAPALRLHY